MNNLFDWLGGAIISALMLCIVVAVVSGTVVLFRMAFMGG